MAEEVAMKTTLHSFTATERGAVARERGERREERECQQVGIIRVVLSMTR